MENQPSTFKEKCVNCMKGTNLIKTLVVVVCLVMVTRQLTTCTRKLINRPITTYTHFDFNRSIQYPSITFCREPPYKFNKMLEYGLFGHPRYTSTWMNYNFTTPLEELWANITYEPNEFFVQYGLEGSSDNVEVTTTIGFMNGRCYTFSPKILISRASKISGYSVTLQYNVEDLETTTSIYPPGYHVFIHYTREPYTEVTVYNGGLVDYLYCNVGETIDVKLTVDQYVMISNDVDPCVHDDSYSANTCTTRYVWNKVGSMAGCSGPWMQDSDLPPCNNFTSLRTLISSYMLLYQHHNCSVCPRFCRSLLYNAYVNDRHTFTWNPIVSAWTPKSSDAALQTQLFLYFNNLMVSVYEEGYNYDWSNFLSDLGGSVGFLLGLSVVGIISTFGKLYSTVIKPSMRTPKNMTAVKPPVQPPKAQYNGCITCNNNMKLKRNYY